MTDTLSKLYLELAHVVPDGTKTFRDIENEAEIERLLKYAQHLPNCNVLHDDDDKTCTCGWED